MPIASLEGEGEKFGIGEDFAKGIEAHGITVFCFVFFSTRPRGAVWQRCRRLSIVFRRPLQSLSMEKAALRKRLLELELEKAEREQLQKAQKTKQPSEILAPACRFFRSGGCAKGKDCRFSHVLPSVTHNSATPPCSEVLLSDFVRLYENWPQGHGADRISAAEAATSGTVRHDLLVEADHVGRIIGKEGRTRRGICESTGCEVFVFNKDGAPPDTVGHLRLVSIVGLPMAVCNANKAVSDAISFRGASLQPRPTQGEVFQHACASCGSTRRLGAFTYDEQALGAAARCRVCTDPASLCTCARCGATKPYLCFGTSQFAMEGPTDPRTFKKSKGAATSKPTDPKSKDALKPGALCKVCTSVLWQACAHCGEHKKVKTFSKEQRSCSAAAVCDACEQRNPDWRAQEALIYESLLPLEGEDEGQSELNAPPKLSSQESSPPLTRSPVLAAGDKEVELARLKAVCSNGAGRGAHPPADRCRRERRD